MVEKAAGILNLSGLIFTLFQIVIWTYNISPEYTKGKSYNDK